MDAIHSPTDTELVDLHDRLWHDPRRRDDRSEFQECESCGRAVRWIANLGSRTGGNMQIVARPVTTAAWFDPDAHAGLVAVFVDRTGFTVSRATDPDEIDTAFLYQCHWDVCEQSRLERDRISSTRRRTALRQPDAANDEDDGGGRLDALLRYAAWRESRAGAAGTGYDQA